MTIGEDRVRVKFNPSDNSLVSQIKQKTAELIDLCEKHKDDCKRKAVPRTLYETTPINRAIDLWSTAQTHYEDAAMWAVKAATS